MLDIIPPSCPGWRVSFPVALRSGPRSHGLHLPPTPPILSCPFVADDWVRICSDVYRFLFAAGCLARAKPTLRFGPGRDSIVDVRDLTADARYEWRAAVCDYVRRFCPSHR